MKTKTCFRSKFYRCVRCPLTSTDPGELCEPVEIREPRRFLSLIALVAVVGCGGSDFSFSPAEKLGHDAGVALAPDASATADSAPSNADADSGSAPTSDAAPPVCANGDVRCLTIQPQTCINGVWIANGELCPNACLSGACVECTPGEKSCADDTHIETCNAQGVWEAQSPCIGGTQCFAGKCTSICCGIYSCTYGKQVCYDGTGAISCAGGICRIGAGCAGSTITPC